MEIDGLEALRTELAQLRAEHRRLRRFGALGALALAAVVGVGAGLREDARSLETRELVLLNAAGKPCARWVAEKGDVVLELGRARDGEAPLRLRADNSGAVSIALAVGEGRAQMGVLADGTANFLLNQGGELGGVNATVTSGGDATLGVQAPGGTPAVGLHAGPESAAGLRLYDGQGRERLRAELVEKHEPVIECVDTKGSKIFAAP